MANEAYTAKERLYLDSKGEVVTGNDPDRVSLLVGAGGTLPHRTAAAHGLIAETPNTSDLPGPDNSPDGDNAREAKAKLEEQTANEKAVTSDSTENKAVKGPRETKSPAPSVVAALSAKSDADLLAIAADRGMTVKAGMTKAELVDAIARNAGYTVPGSQG